MLEPLKSEELDALLREDDNPGCNKVSAARHFFGEQDLAQGVEALLQAFRIFNPYLLFEEKDGLRDWNNWHIRFYDPPFNPLFLRPCGNSIEIFEYDKFLVAYIMLGCPQNWVRMLQRIWAYGDDVYVKKVKKGLMLRPLDCDKLAALARDDNDSDCESIRRTKACLGKDKDLASGIVCLFEGWEVFAPRIHQMKDHWLLRFRDSPFRSLLIRPSTDPSVVDVYAFEKPVNSFHIIDNTQTSDREMWQRLLIFVWDYGRRRLEHRRQKEELQRLSHKKHTGSQPKGKRTEKPLLHKVLHTAGFKAQRGLVPRANKTAAIQAKEDHIMEDIDIGVHSEVSQSRQLFNQKPPLGATDPNPRFGYSLKAKDTENGQTTKAATDDVDIGALNIMDCQP